MLVTHLKLKSKILQCSTENTQNRLLSLSNPYWSFLKDCWIFEINTLLFLKLESNCLYAL